MTNKNIKAVCFDFGGVIELFEGNLLGEIAKFLDVPLTDFKKEYFQYNHLSNVENMNWDEMTAKVALLFDDSPGVKEKVLSIIKEIHAKNKINTALLEIFPLLQKQGYKVAILSNNTTELRKRLTDNGIIKLVDEVIISAEIGFQKPHREAFQFLFEKLKVSPGEVIFVDDAPKSLEKASEIGYIPVLFKNNEQLKADLKKLGINI